MAKVNFSTLRRPKDEPVRIECADPNLNEPMVVWLKPLDEIADEQAQETADQLTAMYVTGGFYHPKTGKWEKEPVPYPLIDDQPVKVSGRFFRIVARIEAMQCPPDPTDRYSLDELVACACLTPNAWRALVSSIPSAESGKA